MRKIIVEEWISLDGYVADRNGNLDFFAGKVRDAYTSSSQLNFLKTLDCILLGRNTYSQFAALWPERTTDRDALAHFMNTGEKIVFSNTLPQAPWGKWNPARVEQYLLATVHKLKRIPGGDLVVWGSASIAQALMMEGLIDACRLHVCPSLLGQGTRLFPETIQPSVLTLTEIHHNPNGTVLLHYQIKPS